MITSFNRLCRSQNTSKVILSPTFERPTELHKNMFVILKDAVNTYYLNFDLYINFCPLNISTKSPN